MSCKLFLVLSAAVWVFASLEAASLHATLDKTNAVEQKLDYDDVVANVRSARQAYPEDDSGEDSDEDDEEDDAELQQQAAIRRQQAFEQSVDDSQEGSDEDNEDNFGDEYFGRRLKRDLSALENNNKIEENSPPATETTNNQHKLPAVELASTSSPAPSATNSSNTSVLILIRDAIKKVTELPNSQQVATSAQQYFQMFEHFLQQTIEQVIGDDDEEDEVESTTIAGETENETINETVTEIMDQNDKQPLIETSDKESSNDAELPQPEKKPQNATA